MHKYKCSRCGKITEFKNKLTRKHLCPAIGCDEYLISADLQPEDDSREWPGYDLPLTKIWGLSDTGRHRFVPRMRWDKTRGGGQFANGIVENWSETTLKKSTGWVDVGKKVGRINSTSSIMGKTAHNYTHRGTKYIREGEVWKQSEEWLHLLGDNLGGGTTEENLVAGSVAANTEMLALEEIIANSPGYRVNITAYCSKPNVGEVIRYQICTKDTYRGNHLGFTWDIDLNNRYLTGVEYQAVQSKLNRWMVNAKSLLDAWNRLGMYEKQGF